LLGSVCHLWSFIFRIKKGGESWEGSVILFSAEYKKTRAEGWGRHAKTMMNTKADEDQT
jgi:hypothetical protein